MRRIGKGGYGYPLRVESGFPRKTLAIAATALVALSARAESVDDRLSTRQLQKLPSNSAPVLPGELVWLTDPSLEQQQVQLKNRILARLRALEPPAGARALADWLQSLPITGRQVPVESDLATVLANPRIDFALQSRSTLSTYRIPDRVAVLQAHGEPCMVQLSASVSVESLLQHCVPQHASHRAWVIQPDGHLFSVAIASWNRYAEVMVAPGAWVWLVPPAWSDNDALGLEIAQFLATQPVDQAVMRGQPGAQPQPMQAASSVPVLQGAGAIGWRPYHSSNDWGEVGLLQTPTARTAPLGDIRFTASRAYPYTRMNVFMQPTGWLEFGFRYTDIATALYGPNIAGDQTYKDKSLDFKLILNEEGRYLPQMALGMRDIGGTGLFSSEYLVASKRSGPLDWSLGVGWGNMASSATLGNPLASVFPNLKNRQLQVGQGGTVSTGTMFAGNAAAFGGVQWTSPSGQWALKLELDGNDYRQEPFGQDFGASSPINAGLSYKLWPGADLSLALERGNRLAFALTFSGNVRSVMAPKPLDPAPPTAAQLVAARTTPIATQWPVHPDDVFEKLAAPIKAQTGWQLRALDVSQGSWQVWLEMDDAAYAQERLEKLFAVLATELPPQGNGVDIHLSNLALSLRSLHWDRSQWLAQQVYPDLPSLQLAAQEWRRPPSQDVVKASADGEGATNAVRDQGSANRLGAQWGWGTTFSHILGGPNNFLLYQAGLRAYGQYRFDENTWVFGQANLRLLDNYNNFVYDAPSNLPRVRTDQRSYVITSQTTIPVAQLTRTFDVGMGHYASAYAGLLEPMYAGVGAEWLWRPWRSRWAFGLDVNQVQQRAFEQDLGLRPYQTTTGHAAVYWDTGLNGVVAKAFVGKYLAKDNGFTLDVSRTFSNGASIGVWATKTDVSAQQFGEGSFDKGLYINIPFDAMLPRATPSFASIVWTPLTRDGGARLSRRFPLFDLTRHADDRAWLFRASTPELARAELDAEPHSVAGLLSPRSPMRVGLADSFKLPQTVANTQLDHTALLGAGGMVLLSGLADKAVDETLGRRDGSNTAWGQAFNTVPYAMAAGTLAASVGLWGDDARQTAYASLSAASWALGANMVTKSLIGRARPEQDRGPGEFSGPSSTSSQSSFASNHVTAAMALATPFAKRYDMPWLYGLAAATALGRIEAREHWASDTVAGALLGYTMGALAIEHQDGRARKFSVGTTGKTVFVTMKY